jgi:aldose sugar dehydrogenase
VINYWSQKNWSALGIEESTVHLSSYGKKTVGPTAIKFLNSDKLGNQYENDLFVGSYNLGTIFHFDLKDNRSELELHDALKDKIADSNDELKDVIFAEELGGVTDIDEGSDGNVYILSNYLNKASILKISAS